MDKFRVGQSYLVAYKLGNGTITKNLKFKGWSWPSDVDSTSCAIFEPTVKHETKFRIGKKYIIKHVDTIGIPLCNIVESLS